jgi:hypothetical protein
MQIFDHFGHLTHGHRFGVFLAVAIGVLVAMGIGFWGALSGRKDPDD